MNLIELKRLFIEALDKTYPITEIESFYYLLTAHYLKKNRLDIGLQPDFNIEDRILKKYLLALSQLKDEYPIQYIIGKTEFMCLQFNIDENVLIPRPETEELISWILSLHDMHSNLKLLDIGTGSGCIAIALSKNLKKAHVNAIDISEPALSLARVNAQNNTVNIKFMCGDVLKIDKLDQFYDIIVSNPPYVRESEKEAMQNNVLKYEPGMALFVSDEDPLIFYKKIARLAFHSLKDGGELFFEINQYLGDSVKELLIHLGFGSIELRKDLYGANRMIRAVKI